MKVNSVTEDFPQIGLHGPNNEWHLSFLCPWKLNLNSGKTYRSKLIEGEGICFKELVGMSLESKDLNAYPAQFIFSNAQLELLEYTFLGEMWTFIESGIAYRSELPNPYSKSNLLSGLRFLGIPQHRYCIKSNIYSESAYIWCLENKYYVDAAPPPDNAENVSLFHDVSEAYISLLTIFINEDLEM